MDILRCIGCGSVIQSNDPASPGYLPQSKLPEGDETVVCRRCFRLKHYNEVTPLHVTQDEYYRIISQIADDDALVVNIVDIFDLEGSLIPQIGKLTNHNDMIVLANKRDLLPKSVSDAKLLHHIRKIVSDHHLKPLRIHLMSARKYQHIDDVMDSILELAKGRDIYIVGATNVGKSTFINTLLKAYADSAEDVITVSQAAGTTLDMIKIPIGDQYIVDTPGILNDIQLTHHVSAASLKAITPTKEIKAKIYQLDPRQTIFLGGLARIDFVRGERTSFVCYAAPGITLHRTKLERADDLFANRVGTVLVPPVADERFDLAMTPFHVPAGKHDVVLPGLGFVTVKGPIDIRVHVHPRTRPYLREALI